MITETHERKVEVATALRAYQRVLSDGAREVRRSHRADRGSGRYLIRASRWTIRLQALSLQEDLREFRVFPRIPGRQR